MLNQAAARPEPATAAVFESLPGSPALWVWPRHGGIGWAVTGFVFPAQYGTRHESDGARKHRRVIEAGRQARSMAGPGETLAFSTVRAFPKMLAGRLKNSHHGRQAGRHVVHILRRAVWSLEIVDSISDTKSSTRSELA